MKVLNVKVAEPVANALERARRTMESLEAGEIPEPYFGIGFESLAQLSEVFSLERWELAARLSAEGPLTVARLVERLGRDKEDVQRDLETLIEWTVVERLSDDRVWVPWDEVALHLPLAKRAA